MEYTTTPVSCPSLKSSELQCVASQFLGTMAGACMITGDGEQLGEAIMYGDSLGGQTYILLIDDGQSVSRYRIQADPGQGPTYDDYDDSIRAWFEHDREPASRIYDVPESFGVLTMREGGES